jgi:hypothetical protein
LGQPSIRCHRRGFQPFLAEFAKTLCLFQAALVALLLDRRRSPFANGALRVEALLSGQRERDAVSAISAEIDRLAASIQPIVQPKRDRATGHDADIHPVTVSNLVDFLSWFQCLKGGVRQYPLPPEKYRQYDFELRGRKFLFLQCLKVQKSTVTSLIRSDGT